MGREGRKGEERAERRGLLEGHEMKPSFSLMGARVWQGFAQEGSSASQAARFLGCASAATFPNSVKSSP